MNVLVFLNHKEHKVQDVVRCEVQDCCSTQRCVLESDFFHE